MKGFFLFLIVLSAVFSGSFMYGRKMRASDEQIGEAPVRFTAAPYTLSDHPFAIIIVGMNNGGSVAKTLGSVFSQKYDNYRVIYIDDASDDGSFELARDLIYESEHLGQVTLVHNEQRLGKLANIYRAVHTCRDEEIVVILEGKDWLSHEWVLARLNAYYADPDLWLTFGQYRDFPNYQLGRCHAPIDEKFRLQSFHFSHLKTFYAGLFKKIRESDLIHGGKFLFASDELAYMIPMLEMARNHYHFIEEILYIANRQVVEAENPDQQIHSERWIRSLDVYPELTTLKLPPCGESL